MIQRIRTKRPLTARLAESIGAVLDKHPLLPLGVVLVALYFINS